ncbi:MAG: hypothetical protein ACE5FU_03415, partial [Nitrospinota bacterium]
MNISKQIMIRKSVMVFVALLFLSFGVKGADVLTHSLSMEGYDILSAKKVFAQEEDDWDEDEDEDEDEEGEEEEAGPDPLELMKDGFVQYPEVIANTDNPNTKMINMDQYEIPAGVGTFFGVSNRDITWILAALHILFASFILGCPMFIIVSEAVGAEKTPGVMKANAFLVALTGLFAGSVVGMIGEVILEAHGAVGGVTIAGFIAGAVLGLATLFGTINNENKSKMGAIIGVVVGAASGAIFAHGTAGAVLGGGT